MNRPVIVSQASKAYYVDQTRTGHYLIMQDHTTERYRWEFHEPGEAPYFGPWRPCMSDALLFAATDWEETGSGGTLAGRLKRAARMYERSGK